MHFDEQIVLELQTSVHFPPEFWRKMAMHPVSKRRSHSLMLLRPAAFAGTTSPKAAVSGSSGCSSRRMSQRESVQ